MYKISFFVPSDHKEIVKKALFEAGAGQFENYDCCSWEVEGVGQFRPLCGSSPFIGTVDMLETVKEFKVEMICHDKWIMKAIEALIESHPYEEPAYEVWKVDTIESL